MTNSKHNRRLALVGISQDADLLVRRLIFLGLGALSLGVIVIVVSSFINQIKSRSLVLAAGDRTGESYILSKAIESVVERNSNIKIEVKETGGTSANLKLLEGKCPDDDSKKCPSAQLATAQADVPAGSSAQTVAVLYQDLFQLVVRDPKIDEFADLQGKRIGLQGQGGQFRSFQDIAAHYGLTQQDFTITGLDAQGKPINGYTDESADKDFWEGKADAVFRVRAPGNKSISELVQRYQGRLVPIDQAAAMRIKYPAFESTTLPKGTYKGSTPAVPASDLPTVGVQRLLMANKTVDADVIREITRILDERRQEIADAIPVESADVKSLATSIGRPATTGSNAPIHPGALAHYDRDKPSFIQENADYVGLILTLSLLGWSWLRELKRWIERKQKNQSDGYIQATINLIDDPRPAEDRLELLDDVFEKAAKDLINENISQESFRTFNEAYKTVREVLERKQKLPRTVLQQQH